MNMATVLSSRSESLLLHGTSPSSTYSEWLEKVLVLLHTAYRPQ